MENGPFSGIAIVKYGSEVEDIIRYKDGLRHGECTSKYGRSFWKNGKQNGYYEFDDGSVIIKGEYKDDVPVGSWSYVDKNLPGKFSFFWSYDTEGRLHGLCYIPITKTGRSLIKELNDQCFDTPLSHYQIFCATYVEAEFSHGKRVKKSTLWEVDDKGNVKEISY